MSERLTIVPYDTTLRDGGQTPGVTFSVENKIRVARKLSEIGFPYIEVGWPGANPTDTEFFQRAKELDLGASQLVTFGMTARVRKVNSKPEEDEGLKALLEGGTDIITLFGKSWTLHVTEVLETTLPKNLQTIEDSVKFLRSQGKQVFYDAEHYFDGYKENPEYALETLLAAKAGGTSIVILCDTNGGAIPEFIFEATSQAREVLGKDFPLGIHVHNDGGLALINTLTAVQAGATQVQGTINGTGERCGNVDFCQFLPTATLKYGIEAGLDLTKITQLSRFIELESGFAVPPNAPYVGKNAFRHKGGVHVSAVRKIPRAYEHIDPSLVGNKTSFENSDQGGGANIEEMARKHGFELSRNDPRFRTLVERMKNMKVLGDAQEFLLLHDVLSNEPRPFEVLERQRNSSTNGHGSSRSASVLININGEKIREIAMGNGPINAFDKALRKVVGEFYHAIHQVKLTHYGMPATQSIGTQAEVTISTEFGANGDRWTSVVCGTDQQVTGEQALIDSYNYYLLRRAKDPSFGGHFTEIPTPHLKV